MGARCHLKSEIGRCARRLISLVSYIANAAVQIVGAFRETPNASTTNSNRGCHAAIRSGNSQPAFNSHSGI